MRKFVSVLLIFLLIFSVAFSAKVYKMKIGIGYNDKSSQYAALIYFKKLIEKRSNGRLQLDVYHSSQLGDDREMIEGISLGTVELACPSTAPLAAFVPEYGVFDLPFLFPDEKAADYVLDSVIGVKLLQKLEKINAIGLCFWENGFRNLTNNVRPIKSPEDLKGLKIRVMQNQVFIDTFRTLGANPTPMAFGELFTALQQGVVDGQENPWQTIYTMKFYEVQKYVSDTGHAYSPFVLMISKTFWKKLPDDLKKIIQDSAIEAKIYQRKLNREMNKAAIEKLKSLMTVTFLTNEARKDFQKAIKPVYDKYRSKYGSLLDEILEKVEEYEKTKNE